MDEYLIPISTVANYYYCPRRYYLESMEIENDDSTYTVEGTIQHESVHKNKIEKRKNLIKVTGLNVYSKKYKLIGKCDLVEFSKNDNGTLVDFIGGHYDISIVEYKRGKPRKSKEYEIQLCAQVLCIEEMFNCKIESACFYYQNSNKKVEINIDESLREETISTIKKINDYINNPFPIEAKLMRRCNKCALHEKCGPENIYIEKYMSELKAL